VNVRAETDCIAIGRGLTHLGSALCCQRPRGNRSQRTSGRHIQDEGVLRALDPDSESEPGVFPDRCGAIRVGLELQGKAHALAPDVCQDRAVPEPTRLRPGPEAVGSGRKRICYYLRNHHFQLLHALVSGEEMSRGLVLERCQGSP
jgi:hypothetical protein